MEEQYIFIFYCKDTVRNILSLRVMDKRSTNSFPFQVPFDIKRFEVAFVSIKVHFCYSVKLFVCLYIFHSSP